MEQNLRADGRMVTEVEAFATYMHHVYKSGIRETV